MKSKKKTPKKGFLSQMYERICYLEKLPLRRAIEIAKANEGKPLRFYRPPPKP